ncbi:MAG TPA: bifunctional ornithine acetyltransferase/N-acetylglutamate synthase, partial [Acidimicrobiales bacterium]|nr:bifunctional ornithine acetyltransferase/N-acetylglutamate synthase [Acidimicrobiales bacterium]
MSVTSTPGFVAGGATCGIKPSGVPDLALVATADRAAVTAAGVFTSNKMTAAPVLVCREHLAATGGKAAAVVLNSGNANA